MTTGSPVGPTACDGCVVSTGWVDNAYHVHCNGCADAAALALANGVEAEQGRRNEASIKGQLRVVATAYFGPLGDLTAEQYLSKLENGLASAMQRQQESYERAEQIDAALAVANSLALTNGEATSAVRACHDWEQRRAMRAEAERDELRGLVQRAAFWPAGHERCGVCYKTLRVCGLNNCCVGIGFRAWLAAHPAIPEGTPTAPKAGDE